MEEVMYEGVQYKGTGGSLTLGDEMLSYKSYPPKRSSIRCSWALFEKLQVSPKSSSQQYIIMNTRSGKTATFAMQDRAMMEEILWDMKKRIEQARQKSAQEQPAATPAPRRNFGVQTLLGFFGRGQQQSDTARLALEQDEVMVINQKFASEIQQDPAISALQQQIQDWKTKIQQQQVRKIQLQKQKIERDNLSTILFEQTGHLKLAMWDIIHEQEEGSNRKQKDQRREYTKAIQKATANKKKPTPNTYNLSSGNNAKDEREANRSKEKEAQELEINTLLKMHHQMVLQNQYSLAQKHAMIIKSLLEREKAGLDAQLQQDLEFKRVLDETDQEITNTYSDAVLRQEHWIEKLQTNNGSTKEDTVPPLVFSKQALRMKAPKRPSVVKSDGISELGESVVNGTTGKDEEQDHYHPPASMTTVHSLQQSTMMANQSVEDAVTYSTVVL